MSKRLRSVTRTESGDWHPEEIKAAVRMTRDSDGHCWSLDRLAVANGLPSYACRAAIRKADADGEAAIAALLGEMPRDIWPSRYRKDGTRVRAPRRESSFTSQNAGRHCENQAMA